MNTRAGSLLCASRALAPCAWAQGCPARPLRVAVGLSTGGAPALVARELGSKMSDELGQPLIVDNCPGASGNLAAGDPGW